MSQPQLNENAINIFVDGSSKLTPRRGGAGVIVVWVDEFGNEETYEESLPSGDKYLVVGMSPDSKDRGHGRATSPATANPRANAELCGCDVVSWLSHDEPIEQG